MQVDNFQKREDKLNAQLAQMKSDCDILAQSLHNTRVREQSSKRNQNQLTVQLQKANLLNSVLAKKMEDFKGNIHFCLLRL